MNRSVTVHCDRCDGEGKLNGTGTATDRIICPVCGGTGSVEKGVTELPRDYCPWCDEDRPMANGSCVNCGDGDE